MPDFPIPKGTRERVIYPWDMQGAPTGEAEADAVIFNASPMFRFSGSANNSICGEVKIPGDRVPGTNVTLRIVYLMASGAGGVGVVLRLRYGIFGLGESGAPALTSIDLPITPPASPNCAQTAAVTITAAQLDAKTQPITLQVVVTRAATDPGDVDPNPLCLVNVIMQYTAYT
jgi:hypothetical protein